jgi:hypothetical protein
MKLARRIDFYQFNLMARKMLVELNGIGNNS